jgi:hypothetical protein
VIAAVLFFCSFRRGKRYGNETYTQKRPDSANNLSIGAFARLGAKRLLRLPDALVFCGCELRTLLARRQNFQY